MTRVLVLPGSVRGSAPDAALAGAATRELALLGHAVTRLSLADYPLPLYDDGFDERRGLPEAAAQLGHQLAAHDAVLIVTPEVNGGPAPALVNALAWLSHARSGRGTFGEDRVFALAAASTETSGGLAALLVLRQMLECGLGAVVVPEHLAFSGNPKAFDDHGALADPEQAARLRRLLEAMARRARLLRRETGG